MSYIRSTKPHKRPGKTATQARRARALARLHKQYAAKPSERARLEIARLVQRVGAA